MNGTSIIAGGNLPNPGPAWHIIGAGDFNGDGNTDILWQNNDGTPGLWLMNGTSIIGGGNLPKSGNGLARHRNRRLQWRRQVRHPLAKLGRYAFDMGNEWNVRDWDQHAAQSGLTWHVIGTGDFNGDGKSDILWQNSDGTPGFWLMNGTTLNGGGLVTNPGATWQAKDDGPFDTSQNGAQTGLGSMPPALSDNSAGSTGIGSQLGNITPPPSAPASYIAACI